MILRIYAWMQDQQITWGTIAFFASFLVTITIAGIIILSIIFAFSTIERVPSCQEDELVVGIGDFDDGYWDEYICVHPEVIINGS